MIKARATKLDGVLIIEAKSFADERGLFAEQWNAAHYREAGLDLDVRQVNYSISRQGVLRGLHFQEPKAQGKLVCMTAGEIYDVAVDIRKGSPDFGRHVGIHLTSDPPLQLWIPPGFAHGYAVLSASATLLYVVTDHVYDPSVSRTILWNDPDLGIEWPLENPLIAAKDAAAHPLKDTANLPIYRSAPERVERHA